jgi:hypothetical protein
VPPSKEDVRRQLDGIHQLAGGILKEINALLYTPASMIKSDQGLDAVSDRLNPMQSMLFYNMIKP